MSRDLPNRKKKEERKYIDNDLWKSKPESPICHMGTFQSSPLLLVFSLYICFTFSYSVVLGYSVLFLFSLFVFFAFQFSRILLIYSLAQIFLFSVMSGLLISPSKALFSSVTVVLFFISPPTPLVLC